MPDFFELPSLERPIVPLMRTQLADVVKVFANGIPGLAPVIRALNHLAKPVRALGGIDPVGVYRGTFEVEYFPTTEQGAFNVPAFSGFVRSEHKGSFPRSD